MGYAISLLCSCHCSSDKSTTEQNPPPQPDSTAITQLTGRYKRHSPELPRDAARKTAPVAVPQWLSNSPPGECQRQRWSPSSSTTACTFQQPRVPSKQSAILTQTAPLPWTAPLLLTQPLPGKSASHSSTPAQCIPTRSGGALRFTWLPAASAAWLALTQSLPKQTN